MHAARLSLTLAAVAGLAACNPEQAEPPQPVETAETPMAPAQPQAPTAPPLAYACESGQSVQVQYIDQATTQVAYKGQTYTLRPAPSASGARFTGSGIEWWTAARDGQESATLSRLGPNQDVGVAVLERCARPTTPADPSQAPPGPLPAPGQTPLQPTPGVAPAAPPCRGPQLKLSADGQDAGAGQRGLTVGVQNVGRQPCTLGGQPTVALADRQGRALTAIRSEPLLAPAAPAPAPVLLQSQGKAWFDMTWSAETGAPNPAACANAALVRVTAPGDTSPMLLAQTLTVCGGRVRVGTFRATPAPQ